jgi:hypothetical protein
MRLVTLLHLVHYLATLQQRLYQPWLHGTMATSSTHRVRGSRHCSVDQTSKKAVVGLGVSCHDRPVWHDLYLLSLAGTADVLVYPMLSSPYCALLRRTRDASTGGQISYAASHTRSMEGPFSSVIVVVVREERRILLLLLLLLRQMMVLSGMFLGWTPFINQNRHLISVIIIIIINKQYSFFNNKREAAATKRQQQE